jgi:hypothetical protein
MEANQEYALDFMRKLRAHNGDIGIAPHTYFPKFLDELKDADRRAGIEAGFKLMQLCQRFYAVGPRISSGMAEEIKIAENLGITIIYVPNPDEFFAPKPEKTTEKRRWPFDSLFEKLRSWLCLS